MGRLDNPWDNPWHEEKETSFEKWMADQELADDWMDNVSKFCVTGTNKKMKEDAVK